MRFFRLRLLVMMLALRRGVEGFGTGPGSCEEGKSPVGAVHEVFRPGFGPNPLGTLDDGQYELLLEGIPLDDASPVAVMAGATYTVELKVADGDTTAALNFFRGFLVRLSSPNDIIQPRNFLTSSDENVVSDYEVCANLPVSVGSFVHRSKENKSSIAGTLIVPTGTENGEMVAEVTVVRSNSAEEGSYFYHSAFTLLVVNDAATPPPSTESLATDSPAVTGTPTPNTLTTEPPTTPPTASPSLSTEAPTESTPTPTESTASPSASTPAPSISTTSPPSESAPAPSTSTAFPSESTPIPSGETSAPTMGSSLETMEPRITPPEFILEMDPSMLPSSPKHKSKKMSKANKMSKAKKQKKYSGTDCIGDDGVRCERYTSNWLWRRMEFLRNDVDSKLIATSSSGIGQKTGRRNLRQNRGSLPRRRKSGK